MSADQLEIGLKPSADKAYQGVLLGQQLCQEMMDIAMKLFEQMRQR
jgi:hypothetical protein